MRTHSRYGWRRDTPDFRDIKFSLPKMAKLPDHIDLRDQCPQVYNQGDLGSCTANALGSLCQFNLLKFNHDDKTPPSRLFIYYNERVIERTINEDAGAEIRNGIKSLVKQGFCYEHSWPYDVSKFTNKPPVNCYKEALTNQIEQYARVSHNLTAIKTTLAAGFPIAFGFMVYESFESKEVSKTGVANYPSHGERSLGGHAVALVGYHDNTQRFLVRNSWGEKLGDKGYFTMPYSYILDNQLSADFWVIKWVEL